MSRASTHADTSVDLEGLAEFSNPRYNEPLYNEENLAAIRKLIEARNERLARKRGPKRGAPLLKLRRPSGAVAYGALRFPRSLRPNAKWVALGMDSNVSVIRQLLTDTWGLPRPWAIISVTGAALNSTFDLSAAQLDEFKSGLLQAARISNAWVVTGGTDSGVMGLVGKAMAQQRTDEQGVCLGITTFGILKGQEGLEQVFHKTGYKGVERVFPYDAYREDPAPARLDPYHSHFLFVDAGAEQKGAFGKEIKLRALCARRAPLPPQAISLAHEH